MEILITAGSQNSHRRRWFHMHLQRQPGLLHPLGRPHRHLRPLRRHQPHIPRAPQLSLYGRLRFRASPLRPPQRIHRPPPRPHRHLPRLHHLHANLLRGAHVCRALDSSFVLRHLRLRSHSRHRRSIRRHLRQSVSSRHSHGALHDRDDDGTALRPNHLWFRVAAVVAVAVLGRGDDCCSRVAVGVDAAGDVCASAA